MTESAQTGTESAQTGTESGAIGDSTGLDSAESGGPDTPYVPEFELSDCRYPLPPEAGVSCGLLTVPEDRDDPEGRDIRLHVSIFESNSPQPQADPVFILNGGPGASSLPVFALLLSPVGDLLREHRQLVYVDQRGTNWSEPALYCPEPLQIDASAGYAEYIAATAESMHACYQSLSAGDADLSSYDTLENAADLEDLRIALGYDRINLLGASYGTRLAMAYMREYPDAIRSVLLDSVLPPNVNPFHEGTASVRSALDALFAAYPEAEAQFDQVTAALREQAVVVTVGDEGGRHEIAVDDLVFVNFVRNAVTQSPPDPGLANAIAAATAGDLLLPAQAWLETLAQDLSGGPGSPDPANGMYASVFCAEDGSRTTVAEAVALDAEYPEANPSVRDWAVGYQIDNLLAPCEYWDVEPIDAPTYYDPLVSDLPTLILAGQLDAQTPPYFATAASEGLGQSATFELPTGHVTLAVPCGAGLAAAFLDDPQAVPESDCATLVGS
ncbi:MAG: alpha/beta fold hydrolase [Myxococcota bacterium]